MRLGLLALLVILTACYRPEARDCAVACGPGGACPEGATCSYGLCTAGAACPAPEVAPSCLACEAADRPAVRCRGDAVVACGQGVWSEAVVCSGAQPVCLDGRCRACQPGTKRCQDGCVQTCGVSEGWATVQPCAPCAAPATRQLIAIGWSHGCALFQGGVRCWGGNDHGQLGLEDRYDRGLIPGDLASPLPAKLGSGVRVTALAAGGRHTCALLDTGQVKCWGDNGQGQLGLGDTNNRGDERGEMGDALRAVDLGLRRTATAISAGALHTCAVLDTGQVKCWGLNNFGQLGVGDTDARGDQPCEMGEDLPAVDLGGEAAVSVVAGGYHSCALLAGGDVRCWGVNNRGQLGVGDMVNRGDRPGAPSEPILFVAGPNLLLAPVALAAGSSHTCALFDGGGLRCWGVNNAGQLGRGNSSNQTDPTSLTDVAVATAVATGGQHACALVDDGRVKCWGLNNFGQLGLDFVKLEISAHENWGDGSGETVEALPDVDLGGRAGEGSPPLLARAVAAGGDHTCAVLETGRIKCWGENAFGQLGLEEPGHRGDDAHEMGEQLPEVQIPELVAGF